MCKAFSGVLKHDLTWVEKSNPHLHSHTAICQAAGITPEMEDRYLRVECSTDNYTKPVSEWEFSIEGTNPQWAKDEMPRIEAMTREAAQRWKDRYTNGVEIDRVTEEMHIVTLSGTTTIATVTGGDVRSRDTSTVNIKTVTNGDVRSWGGKLTIKNDKREPHNDPTHQHQHSE